ncbi:MAG: hypothetical protein R3268_08430 [Acidiferrobacterales bacterium]|nr:hypothetical protein [Acidiferrobacterales bacterium]
MIVRKQQDASHRKLDDKKDPYKAPDKNPMDFEDLTKTPAQSGIAGVTKGDSGSVVWGAFGPGSASPKDPQLTLERLGRHASAPGRNCPIHYQYAPEALVKPAEFETDSVYVIGGLYGNQFALHTIFRLRDGEKNDVRLVFNGDFNWFDIDAAGFEHTNKTVLQHIALRGNVETELASLNEEAGCGCVYPYWVDEQEVQRSNSIMQRLRETARAFPRLRQRLGSLPMHMVVSVGGLRIGVVHGDAESLAGWGFSHVALTQAVQQRRVRNFFNQARVRIFASSHTCLPVARNFELADGQCVVINNGAAGMPNFLGTRFGLITRISVRPAAHIRSIYGYRLDGVYVEALPVYYDHAAWQRAFLSNWPPGSPAYESYFQRVNHGPDYTVARALRGASKWRNFDEMGTAEDYLRD